MACLKVHAGIYLIERNFELLYMYLPFCLFEAELCILLST